MEKTLLEKIDSRTLPKGLKNAIMRLPVADREQSNILHHGGVEKKMQRSSWVLSSQSK